MARLSNVNEGEELKDLAITQVMEHKRTVRTTYGRRSRNELSMQVEERPHIYDVPLSPPKKSQSRSSLMSGFRSSIHKGRSSNQTEDAGTPPHRKQKSLLLGSPTSSTPAPGPLLRTNEGRLGLESSSNATPFHSTNDTALQPRVESNTSQVRSKVELSPLPRTAPIDRYSHESAAAETPKQDEYSLRHIQRQPGADASAVPKLEDQVQPATAADSSNTDPTRDVEMPEIDGEVDTREEKHSGNYNRDDDAELFDIEAITACKLNPRGMVLLKVKWEDYEDPSDLTWEPEKVLRKDVPHILDAYFEDLGGRDKVLQDLRDKRAEAKAKPRRNGTARVKGRGISKRRV